MSEADADLSESQASFSSSQFRKDTSKGRFNGEYEPEDEGEEFVPTPLRRNSTVRPPNAVRGDDVRYLLDDDGIGEVAANTANYHEIGG